MLQAIYYWIFGGSIVFLVFVLCGAYNLHNIRKFEKNCPISTVIILIAAAPLYSLLIINIKLWAMAESNE